MKYLYSFMVLFVPWLVLSGKFDPLHVGMGIVCSLLVAYWSADLLFQDREATLGDRLRQLAGFAGYTGWMFGQIVRANLHVFRVAFSPQMHELLAPRMVEFETKLEKELSRFVLANSITLTPGTISTDVGDGDIEVHALTHAAMEDLKTDEMDRRVSATEARRRPRTGAPEGGQ